MEFTEDIGSKTYPLVKNVIGHFLIEVVRHSLELKCKYSAFNHRMPPTPMTQRNWEKGPQQRKQNHH